MLVLFLKRLLRFVALFVLVALLSLLVFQKKFIYFPQKSSPEVIASFLNLGGQRLDYETSQGHQTAWLKPAASGEIPEHFWIVCAGNASQALSLQWLQKESHLTKDAFLLVDYPGYGVSQGQPTPTTIRENLEKVVPLAAKATGFPLSEIQERGISFGHSLGSAATLLGAEVFGIRRAILLAPFTSTMEMTLVVVNLPLGWLVTHRFDNRARLAELKKRGGHVWIFHGENDLIIPASMGKTLARELGKSATYHEIPGGGHNDLFDKGGDNIFQAMREARD